MTFLGATEVRGFFDTIALGLNVPTEPSELQRYLDDKSVLDSATLIHELTHYLQFYGTALGYHYLLSVRGIAAVMHEAMAANATDSTLQFPASRWPLDLSSLFKSEENRIFYTQAILSNRYFNEELYGLTYPHFGNNRPIFNSTGPLVTSPLHLNQADEGILAVTGEVLLENSASANEVGFLATNSPVTYRDNAIEASYLRLAPSLQRKYLGFATWLGTFELSHHEPLIYFFLFNQHQAGFLRRLGDYTLARNAKRILTDMHSLREAQAPKSEKDLASLVSEICQATGLDNPFAVIEAMRDTLRSEVAKGDAAWPVDLITSDIFTWILNNPMLALYWPRQPHVLFDNIPIVNVRYRSSSGNQITYYIPSRSLLRSINTTKALLNLRTYLEEVHVIIGLYNHSRVRCPLWVREKPAVCEACGACSGFIPNANITADCPITKNFGDLGLSRQSNEGGDW